MIRRIRAWIARDQDQTPIDVDLVHLHIFEYWDVLMTPDLGTMYAASFARGVKQDFGPKHYAAFERWRDDPVVRNRWLLAYMANPGKWVSLFEERT